MFAELRAKTAPGLIAEHARAKPVTVAFRAKHRGLYRERTWLDYANDVGRHAVALQGLGLRKGDRVAIMGDASADWMICDMAVQAAGAISFGIYPTASVSEVAYQMADAGASIFIAEDQEYVDKILGVADQLPALQAIVMIDASAMYAYQHPKLKRLDDLLAAAGPLQQGHVALAEMAAKVAPTDPAFIVYTSGPPAIPRAH